MAGPGSREVEAVIERLRARRSVLARRLERVKADRRHVTTPLETDADDQAIQRENDEVLDVLDDQERRELDAIEVAFERIEAGCFGLCDDCGAEIDPLRLEALPATPRCLACARRAEAR